MKHRSSVAPTAHETTGAALNAQDFFPERDTLGTFKGGILSPHHRELGWAQSAEPVFGAVPAMALVEWDVALTLWLSWAHEVSLPSTACVCGCVPQFSSAGGVLVLLCGVLGAGIPSRFQG